MSSTAYNVTFTRLSPDRDTPLRFSGGRGPVASDLTGRSHFVFFLDIHRGLHGSGSGQEVSEISRVGSDWVGSGQEDFKPSWVGSGGVAHTRPDPT